MSSLESAAEQAWLAVRDELPAGTLLASAKAGSIVEVRSGERVEIVLALPSRLATELMGAHQERMETLLGAHLEMPVELQVVHRAGTSRQPVADAVDEDLERELERQGVEKLAFYARVMTQVSLPYKKQEGNEYVRRNGRLTVTVMAPSRYGLPYGVLPRLLLVWVTTTAVRTKSRELVLGRTVTEFLEAVGVRRTGGPRGDVTRLRHQMRSLFASTVDVHWDARDDDGRGWDALAGQRVATTFRTWWDPERPDQAGLWDTTVVLSDEFYRHIVDGPVPIDFRALRELGGSAMAIDIYVWLAHRMSYLRRPANIPLNLLQEQFGSQFKRARAFRSEFEGRLQMVSKVMPGLRLEMKPYVLRLYPSPTPVPQRFRNR